VSVAKLATVLFCLLVAAKADPTAKTSTKPDDRFKADILLAFAHSDDETGDVAAYLTRAISDEHRRVAVVCATRGNNGGNNFGPEYGKTLGLVRETEARQALSFLGVSPVWFFDAPDGTSTLDDTVLDSLERWDHASLLGQMVRIIRLTRPEIIITWLPMVVAGENHGDHQASSVIAIEAFDLAGDPQAFSEQLYTSHSDNDLNMPEEGLKPWQPKKLYFFSDAFDTGWNGMRNPSPFHKNFLLGTGPSYTNTEISPIRHESYARLSAEEQRFYLSQEGATAAKALETGNLETFEQPTFFVQGKSLVPSGVTSDIFDGITAGEIPFTPVQHLQRKSSPGLSLQLGGPWTFYDEFWKAHGLQHLSNLLPVPEIAMRVSERMHVPVLISNNTENTENVALRAVLPAGWTNKTPSQTYLVPGHDSYTVDAVVISPSTVTNPWQEIQWDAVVKDKNVGHVALRINVRKPRSLE
jgi:LmbE family N-acetylglucosaminyl deacetylase